MKIKLKSPLAISDLEQLKIRDKILLSGVIYTARDAVMPRLANFDLEGYVIMHTAVSDAGISPTSSNKKEIEDYMPVLSKKGIRMHIGKGSLSEKTVDALNRYNSVFVVCPPVAALLSSKVKSKECIAFEEEGIEAMYKLEVDEIPGIVAVANGESIF